MSAVAHTMPPEAEVLWRPHGGKQSRFMACPTEDILFGGARGGGKTDCLLAKWLVHGGTYGQDARGVIFRRELPQLDDIIERSRDLFEPLGAVYKIQSKSWVHPDGWLLRFRQLYDLGDASKYLGHQYTFIGAEELTNWPDLKPIDKVRGCLRSAKGVPCVFVATANPGGVGHNVVKARYVSPHPEGMTPFTACALCATPMSDSGDYQCDCDERDRAPIERVYIPATLEDNPALKENPQYWRQVVASVAGDLGLLKAWRDGDWDITAGGMFDDIWNRCGVEHAPFKIPESWYVDRGYDDGDAAPYATIWFAEASGEEVYLPNGTTLWFPRGTIFVIEEDYGWNGQANEGTYRTTREIAKRLHEREEYLLEAGLVSSEINAGPADNAIWAVTDGESVADRFEAAGVYWERSIKGPGSRRTGWKRLREMMLNNQAGIDSDPDRDGRATEPGFYVFSNCTQTIRTVKSLPRDKKDRGDVPKAAEDHIGDVCRYRVTMERGAMSQGDAGGA